MVFATVRKARLVMYKNPEMLYVNAFIKKLLSSLYLGYTVSNLDIGGRFAPEDIQEIVEDDPNTL